MNHFKNFVFVHWHRHELMLHASLNYYHYYYYYYLFYFTSVLMKVQNVFRHLWMLLVFEFFLLVSECPPSFPSLVPTVRLLYSFLLQTLCAKMLSSLRNAWLYKNRFCTNLWLSNEFIIKLLIVPAFQFYCYFSTVVTFSMMYCLFGIAVLSICVIFLLCLCFALTLK